MDDPERAAQTTRPKARRKAAPIPHGFYAGSFSPAELEDLAAVETNLQDEIASLRVASRRIFELSKELDQPKEAIQALSLYGMSVMRVARLLQVHATLSGGSNEVMAAISSALDEAWKELRKS